MSSPELLGVEPVVAAEELSIVSRFSTICPICGHQPRDGVRSIRDKGGCLQGIPNLNVLRQLDGRGNPDNRADPVVMSQLFCNCAAFPGDNFEEIRRPLR
jgi:hypothetical protein